MIEEYNKNLHNEAIGKLYQYARELRREETKAEKKLWHYLRNRKLDGLKFRRQHPLDRFIPDFYCHEKKFAIELDGSVHDGRMNENYDEVRTKLLEESGITVIRFKNSEVDDDVFNVLKTIREFIRK